MAESGARDALIRELRDLKRRTGDPSCRTIARKASEESFARTIQAETPLAARSISHGTVFAIFKVGKLKGLGHTLLVAAYLGGDTKRVQQLWEAAKAEEGETRHRSTENAKVSARNEAADIVAAARAQAEKLIADATSRVGALEADIADLASRRTALNRELAEARAELDRIRAEIRQSAADEEADDLFYGDQG
jgi:cell division septum initiation protein DivIVA